MGNYKNKNLKKLTSLNPNPNLNHLYTSVYVISLYSNPQILILTLVLTLTLPQTLILTPTPTLAQTLNPNLNYNHNPVHFLFPTLISLKGQQLQCAADHEGRWQLLSCPKWNSSQFHVSPSLNFTLRKQ